MAEDIFSALRTYIGKMSGGEKSAAEMSAALSTWIKESGEGFKARIEAEIESAASKMGFVRKEDLETLIARIAKLEAVSSANESTSSAAKKSTAAAKKSTTTKKVTATK